MKTKILILTLSLAAAPFLSTYADDGGTLFTTNCGACHSVGKGKLVGPDLKGVDTRHTDAWFLKWVKSSQGLVNSGDKDAAKLFADNNMIVMPDQALNDADIKTILAYIKAGGDAPVTASTDNAADIKATTAAPQKAVPPQQEESYVSQFSSFVTSFSTMEYIFMFLIVMSIMVIYILGQTVKSLTERVKEQKRATV